MIKSNTKDNEDTLFLKGNLQMGNVLYLKGGAILASLHTLLYE